METMYTRTAIYDHDARIARQRYIGAVTRASYTLGFTFLRFEVFACGGQRHEVAIFRNNLLAEALGLEPDHPQFTREPAHVTDIACEFVLIPEGTFMMGSPPDEENRWNDEGPQRRVNVSAFLMARTEVTQAVWEALMDRSIRDQRDLANPDWPMRGEGASNPVYYVSWDEIQEFEKATGLRLPSEAEWEYACRAGTTTRFCFGDDDDDLGDYAWYGGNSSWKTHPVGEKRPNAFGLFDMHGNVWEWCEDRWHSDYDGAPKDGSAWTSGSSADRVLRGGSWLDDARSCRSADRSGYTSGDRLVDLGFRPACSID